MLHRFSCSLFVKICDFFVLSIIINLCFNFFQDDLNLWLPNTKNPPTDLDLEVARFTLLQVGDQFCDLLMQEADAINLNLTEGKPYLKRLQILYYHNTLRMRMMILVIQKFDQFW